MSTEDESRQEPTYMSLHGATYVTGVAMMGIMSVIAETADMGPRPAVAFRFRRQDGTWFSTMVLVSDPEELRKLPPMALSAVEAAVEAAARVGRAP